MLERLTLITNVLGLASALLLGLYLVTRNLRKPVAWLVGLALWALGGNFLNVVLALNPPPEIAPLPAWIAGYLRYIDMGRAFGSNSWLEGWLVVPAIMLWHHATVLLRPGATTPARLARIVSGYVISLAAILLQINTPYLLRADPAGDPLYLNTLTAGGLYLPFFLLLIAFLGMSTTNLWRSAQESSSIIIRKQLLTLAIATSIALLAIPVSFMGSLLGLRIPILAVSLLLLLSVVSIGIGIARYSAISEGRTLRRDFLSYTLTMLLIITLYSLASILSVRVFGVHPGVYVFMLLLAIITHTIVDAVRLSVDRLVFNSGTRALRSKLRDLMDQLADLEDQEEYLRRLLHELCVSVNGTAGVILYFVNDQPEVAARYNWSSNIPIPEVDALRADDIQHLDAEDHLSQAALLVPIYDGRQQIGALLLGRPKNASAYSDQDINQLLYPSDYIAEGLSQAFDRNARLARATSMIERETSRFPWWEDVTITRAVEDALRHLGDFSHLGDSPLIDLRLAQRKGISDQTTHVERGKVVRKLLLEMLAKLRPAGGDPGDPPSQEWHMYMILYQAYVLDIPNRDIMSSLYISEGTFNRTRRAAVQAVTRMIIEMEDMI